MRKDENVKLIDLVGNTPLITIPQSKYKNVTVMAKLEWMNPSGSVKDRAAKAIFEDALDKGQLESKVLIDATSGNTGIAYAMLGAFYGVPVELALPENASPERKLILRNYGATLHLTSALEGTDGAQRFVEAFSVENQHSHFWADQYNNDNNWRAHYTGTGPEIWAQSEHKVTHFIAGLGTSGTFCGTSRFLQPKGVHCYSVQPDSPMHGLEGWKHMETALVPGIYEEGIADETRVVSTDRAYKTAVAAARYLGLHISPSAAANLAAALDVADEVSSGCIVTVFPDNASKYLQDPFWSDDDYLIENPF